MFVPKLLRALAVPEAAVALPVCPFAEPEVEPVADLLFNVLP
jgi:hypothetical protein